MISTKDEWDNLYFRRKNRVCRKRNTRRSVRRVKESIAFERTFLQAETELVAINKLEESPKNDDVRVYMRMNDKIAEGMVA